MFITSRNWVSEMFFEPFHERRESFKVLSTKFESVRRHCDVFVTRVITWHVGQHELAGVVFAGAQEVMDFVWLSLLVLKTVTKNVIDCTKLRIYLKK